MENTESYRFDLFKEIRNDFISDFENIPASAGKSSYLLFVYGAEMTCRQSVQAKCYTCDNLRYTHCGIDAEGCCGIVDCPLYKYSPYK